MKQPAAPTQLDLAPPKMWRRIVPRWLRSLIWVDSAARYDAFLSYSWKCDGKNAPVLHAILQQFLRPWYKLRAKIVFRDLSCLPAGSSLEQELFDRMDRSKHLIVLASPCAAHSWGMEIEARHWFSRGRDGEVLVIVTEGECSSWKEIREQLLPAGVRENLVTEPLWISLQHRRAAVLADPESQALRGELVEDLKQVLLRLHAPLTWEELQGEERAQRRRALNAVSLVAILFLVLAVAAVGFARYAQMQTARAEQNAHESQARELAAYATGSLKDDPERSILLAMQAVDATMRFGQPPVRSAIEALHWAILSSHVRLTLPVPDQAYLSAGLAYSPDGKHLATPSSAGMTVWDAESGKESLPPHGHSRPVKDVAFSADGKLLATADDDGTATVWDVASGKSLLTLGAKADSFDRVLFSSHGEYLAAADTVVGSEKVTIWDAKSWTKLLFLRSVEGMRSLALSPDARQFAIAHWQGAQLWDALGGRLLMTLVDSEYPSVRRAETLDVAFSPDGRFVATATNYGSAKIWDAKSGKQRMVLGGHSAGISSIAFSHGGKQLATAGLDKTVKVWDAESGAQLLTLSGHTYGVGKLAFSPDDKRLATLSGDGTSRIWDLDIGSELLSLRAPSAIHGVAFSADGSRLITHTEEGGGVWEADTGRELRTIPVDGIASAVYMPGDDRLAIAVWNEDEGSWVAIYDMKSGDELLDLADLPGIVDLLAGSLDGRHLATGTQGVVTLWNAENGKKLLTLPAEGVSAISYSPNGKRLVTTSSDAFKVWDAENGTFLRAFPGSIIAQEDFGNSAFSPDGALLVVAGDNGADVWEVETGKRLATLRGQKGGDLFNSVAFSPDGKWIATSTSSVESIITLWEAQSGRDWLTLHGNSGAVLRVAFSSDGKRLATTNQDGTVHVYAIDIRELLALARSRVTRSLTRDECRLYLHTENCPIVP